MAAEPRVTMPPIDPWYTWTDLSCPVCDRGHGSCVVAHVATHAALYPLQTGLSTLRVQISMLMLMEQSTSTMCSLRLSAPTSSVCVLMILNDDE